MQLSAEHIDVATTEDAVANRDRQGDRAATRQQQRHGRAHKVGHIAAIGHQRQLGRANPGDRQPEAGRITRHARSGCDGGNVGRVAGPADADVINAH